MSRDFRASPGHGFVCQKSKLKTFRKSFPAVNSVEKRTLRAAIEVKLANLSLGCEIIVANIGKISKNQQTSAKTTEITRPC